MSLEIGWTTREGRICTLRANGCRKSRGEQGTDGAKGSQDIRIGAIIDIPAIVAGQRDMLPAQWCDVARDFVGRADVHQRHHAIAGVPQDDSGDEQVEAGCAVGLILEPPVAQLAGLVEESSEERRAGKECVRTCKWRWPRYPAK